MLMKVVSGMVTSFVALYVSFFACEFPEKYKKIVTLPFFALHMFI